MIGEGKVIGVVIKIFEISTKYKINSPNHNPTPNNTTNAHAKLAYVRILSLASVRKE